MSQFSSEYAYYDRLHAEKYRDENQNRENHCRTMAANLASNKIHEEKIYDALKNNRFIPAGRIQAALGARDREVSPFNCSVSQKIEDSMTSIMMAQMNSVKILRLGTGIGYNFSHLRPQGDLIVKLKTKASGPLSFMRGFNEYASVIASSGHRRGAQMGILNVDHPDIEAFIDAKMEKGKYQCFNFSVGITHEFMYAVHADKDWQLKFGGKVYKVLKARDLWDRIMRNAYMSAEPGVIFLDRINETNNLWYCEKIEATNPCVTPDTLILTKQGYKPISNLVGKSVEVWNGKNWSTVTPKVTGENQDILRVTFDNGYELECTPYHKFVLEDGTLVPASSLRKGDKLADANYPVIDTGEDVIDAYTQGFYQGDGWVDNRGRQWIALYGNKKELVDILAETKYSEYSISGGYEGTDLTDTRYMFRVSGMKDKGFVPSVDWSVKSRLQWFAGLCDSDGTCTYSEESVGVQITNKDYTFLKNVSLLLTTLGVFTRISPMRDLWRLTLKSSELYKLQNLGFVTHRLNIETNNPKYIVKNTVKVTNVFERKDKESKVYCFNEPELHQGVFNGILTGQCAEQPLPPYGLCTLGSFNMIAYINDPELLEHDAKVFVEAYDNIFDRALYAIPEHKTEALNKRRIGLGYTGIANAIEHYLGAPSYGNADFCTVLEHMCERLTYHCYRASVELAKERGPFPLFDSGKYGDGKFIKSLPGDLQDSIAKYGIRNSHIISYAPCGTISQAAGNISSGVEPIFYHKVDRKVYMKDGLQEVTLQDYNVRERGFYGKTLEECTMEDHTRVLGIIQRYTDSAVSKTINVAPSCSFEDYKNVYWDVYELGAKGCTVFRPTEIRGAVIMKAKEEVKEVRTSNCKDGVCSM